MSRIDAARIAVLAFAGAVLAGCENDAASHQIDGSRDNALTLIREQRYFWESTANVALVVARYPDCQRRYALNPMPLGEARADLYRIGSATYLLRNGNVWYAIDQRACALQQAIPPQPDQVGVAVGAFDRQDNKLRFLAAAPQPSGR